MVTEIAALNNCIKESSEKNWHNPHNDIHLEILKNQIVIMEALIAVLKKAEN